ncbi:MAG: hemerythrin family protein [Proteobacteria bacterium]|nr:hemerythrin family protein [Pseudomonadota bacterium]
MKWKKDCRLGIDDIDSQHRLLFAIANEINDIHNPEDQEPEIKYLINHIRQYVKDHFAHEETFLEKHNYPELEKHKESHKIIIEEINHTLTSSKSIQALYEQLGYLMNVWIKDHILSMDKKYATWYHAQKSDNSADTLGTGRQG